MAYVFKKDKNGKLKLIKPSTSATSTTDKSDLLKITNSHNSHTSLKRTIEENSSAILEVPIEKETEKFIETRDWVIPKKFMMPDWVEKNLKDFKDQAREIISNADESSIDSINPKIKKLIEELILDNKVKPKYPLNKKTLGKLSNEMWKVFGEDEFMYRYWILQEAGFFLSTFKPSGFEPEALQLPEKFVKRKDALLKEFEKRVKEHGKDKAVAWIDKEFNNLTNEVIDYWEEKGINVVDMIRSGARGGPADIRKMLVAVGLSIDSSGKPNDVIMTSQIEGLSQTQFFHYSSQAIMALYAKSSETAVPGYLARKLSTVADAVNLSEVEDCKTKRFLEVTVLDSDVLNALDGRVLHTGKVIDSEKDTNLIGKKIKIRSPLYCKATDGICATCYNKKIIQKMNWQPGEKIGLHAATTLGDQALVNLTLKKSHVGLSLNMETVDLEKDIFQFAE